MESFYKKWFFPHLMDLALGGEPFSGLRGELLSRARGEVLEIGLGTGLNLAHYPKTVKQVHGVEPSEAMLGRAQKRIEASGLSVTSYLGGAEELPFEDQRFDQVVSSWTLCSIADLPAALREIKRVLKPTGIFFFVEHGAHPNWRVRKWQDRLNPLHQHISGGCNLNRDFATLLRAQGFCFENLSCFELPGEPKLFNYHYFGTARILE
ncbi:MAG: hypothetical protein A2508_10270 [Candidatus Lambdaproteobacteria bacterium RIFOXYD12_FULL_49_8]|uniref:Methyltransferase type 11 domain-containing protein n=1 Tax=Candidatus Lambdaproteobacteria bacterium RIFOXYD2_FULL_50_16 TaxID=1817772 RepID=A0A1F6GFG5_9PROT|nr:MAG: hypothetical protein A2527_00810 [Candidatus Lambdaproteobacteria bacterium RIFOXYD2_FULL_50_16]OGG97760.1 MAG: hypothetical protein A2508_10270 [Candidatus Lambdaproteobacteria bacterium RIFOXYD12_FULL_49_8]